MKCENLFSGKYKKIISKWHSAKIFTVIAQNVQAELPEQTV